MSPWNLENLYQRPEFTVIDTDGEVAAILYQNEPYRGRPTRVLAYLGVPKADGGKVPGMVCVHGGGGTAFHEWVGIWNRRGYAAISMDFGGVGPDGTRLPDGGPEQTHEAKFNVSRGWNDIWTYHAVAAILRAHSLLRGMPGVDSEHIGVTGISWGGYLTCIAAGVDERFACAIPVYGCGFLQHNSADEWMRTFAEMTPDERRWWNDYCDPSSYLPGCRAPMLFVTGTNDFAYPLDSVKMSVALVKGPVTMCVRLEMPHGHPEGWSPEEIYRYADHRLRGGPPFPTVGETVVEESSVRAVLLSAQPIRAAYLVYTGDTGKWQERKWRQIPATVAGGIVSAPLPDGVTVCYLAVEDEAGTYVSALHVEFPSGCW